MGKTRGQPQTTLFVRRSICAKIVQYIRRYNYTPRRAWLLLSEINPNTGKFKKRGFQELIEEHYKNRQHKQTFINNLKDRTGRINFYKNHIKRKWLDEYLDFKEEQIERKYNSGIASLLKRR